MSATSFAPTTNYPQGHAERPRVDDTHDWMRAGVAGTLLTGSLLLLSGKRRAGLLVTTAGAALALLQEKEVLQAWWDALPGYLDDAQRMLDQAQTTIDDLTSKRDRIMSLFRR